MFVVNKKNHPGEEMMLKIVVFRTQKKKKKKARFNNDRVFCLFFLFLPLFLSCH